MLLVIICSKVSHRRLLYKLKYYGIQTHTLNWIQAFLTHRTQTVVIDGVTSNTVPVTSGFPQGTVLGPILFLIYINDFPVYLTHSKLRLFADDSIIYKEITCQDDCKKLQSDLDAAARWPIDLWLSTQINVQYSPSLKRKHPSNMTGNYFEHNEQLVFEPFLVCLCCHVYKGPRYYSCIQVLASLMLDMPEILLQGLIFVNFFLSIRQIYFHLK
jgi:hypothetical protein